MTFKDILAAYNEDHDLPHGPIQTLVALNEEGLLGPITDDEVREASGDRHDFESDTNAVINIARDIRIKKCLKFATRCKLDVSMIDEFVEDEDLCPTEDAEHVHAQLLDHMYYG